MATTNEFLEKIGQLADEVKEQVALVEVAMHDHPEHKYELINLMGYPICAYEDLMNMLDKIITSALDNLEKHPGKEEHELTRNTAVSMMDTIITLVTHAVDVRVELFEML